MAVLWKLLCFPGSSTELVVRQSLSWGLRPQARQRFCKKRNPQARHPRLRPPPLKKLPGYCPALFPEARTRWVSLPFGAKRRASGPVTSVYGVAAELLCISAPRLHPSELQIEQSKSTEAIGSSSFSVTIAIADKLLTLNLL